MTGVASKLEDEQSLVSKVQKSIKFVLEVPVLAQQRHSLLGLVVAHVLGLLQGRGKASPGLGQESSIVLELLQLPQNISVLHGQPALGSLQISEVEVGLLNLLVEVIEVVHEVPV